MKIRRTLGMAIGTLSVACAAYAGGACCEAPVIAAADDAKAPSAAVKDAVAKPQTKCPVMGGDIVKTIFVDVKGYRIYMCCKGCEAKIKAEPDQCIEKIKAAGEITEVSPACDKCKEILGSEKCCASKK